MKRPCIEQGCTALTQRTRCQAHQQLQQQQRNAKPARVIYRGDWPAISRALRAEQPWCSECGTGVDLTTDHHDMKVRCRPCHSAREATRRRERTVGGISHP